MKALLGLYSRLAMVSQLVSPTSLEALSKIPFYHPLARWQGPTMVASVDGIPLLEDIIVCASRSSQRSIL